MAKKNKQQIKIEGDITGLKKAMKEGASSVTSLNKELKLNQEQLKGTNNKVNTLKDRLKVLNDTYDKQKQIVLDNEEAYKKSVELYGENSKEAKSLANQLTDNKTKLQKYKNEINETNKKLEEQTNKFITNGKKLEELGDKWQKTGDKMNKAGNVLSVVGAGIAGGLVVSAKAAIDYESAFAGVEKTVEATEEQLQELNKGILDMSTRMPAAATEIAGVAESAGQLGIKTENILGFSEAMIGLGEATNLTADEAASQLAKFANIMGMSQTEFDKLGSSIVDLGNHFATTEADIVNMAMRLAGAGKQVGLNEGQVLGLATALSSVGIEAEMGGSAISKAMVKMQNAVELSSTKLQKVTKKTGMSLHNLQLMSANDSKGFKELAGSLDMTSTELKNIVNAGVDLENFAKISGKSTSEFKKQWKEDAAGALSDFIKGLGDAESKGESAVTMLSEMGLTEVRLRDSLLRAANAGNLFNDAIETGTKAWGKNTALTNEVNKRYETTESQMKMLKNEVTKLGVEFGRELIPSIRTLVQDSKPLLNTISNWIKKFANLDDKTKQIAIKTTALAVASGPLLKAAGSITTTGGKLIKGAGTLIGKIGKTRTETDGLTTSFGKTATSMGLAVGVAVTLSKALFDLATKDTENAKKSAKEFADQIDESKKSLEDYKTSVSENLSVDLSSIENANKLKDELFSLVDANGKVKDSNKERVNFILGELNSALGTEYTLNDNIIEKYDEMKNSIDDVIEKRQAELKLSASEELYKEAIKNQQKYNDELINTRKKIKEMADEHGYTEQQLEQYIETLRYKLADVPEFLINTTPALKNLQNTIDKYDELTGAQDTAEKNLAENYERMKQHDEDYAKFKEGKYDEVGNFIVSVTTDYSDKSVTELRKGIIEQRHTLEDFGKNLQITNDSYAQQNKEAAEKRLSTLAEELRIKTQHIGTLGEEEIDAWRSLAKTSVDEYSKQIGLLPETTRVQIMNATGIVANDMGLKYSFEQVGLNSIEAFKSNDFNKAGSDAAAAIKKGAESQKDNVASAGTTLGSLFTSKFNTAIAPFREAQNAVKGSHADGLAYVPYNGYVARLHEGERVLTKKENADYTRNNVNNTANNININFYPQQMSEAEIDRASRYINRKWGVRA